MCELGVAVGDVRLLLGQRVEDISERGQRFIDSHSLLQRGARDPRSVQTLRSCEIDEIESPGQLDALLCVAGGEVEGEDGVRSAGALVHLGAGHRAVLRGGLHHSIDLILIVRVNRQLDDVRHVHVALQVSLDLVFRGVAVVLSA